MAVVPQIGPEVLVLYRTRESASGTHERSVLARFRYVPIERVSILLGHQSVRITEKHYAA